MRSRSIGGHQWPFVSLGCCNSMNDRAIVVSSKGVVVPVTYRLLVQAQLTPDGGELCPRVLLDLQHRVRMRDAALLRGHHAVPGDRRRRLVGAVERLQPGLEKCKGLRRSQAFR